MQNFKSLDQPGYPDDASFSPIETVRVDLPWVPLSHGSSSFLTQVVLRDHAEAVRSAIDLYMTCRAQPHFDVPHRGRLTIKLWRVLQSAHPHAMYQWGDFSLSFQQFKEMAGEFLKGTEAA